MSEAADVEDDQLTRCDLPRPHREYTRTSSGPATESFPGNTIVFIGGLHRSGTTLLARCLAAHPAASGLTDTGVSEDEGQHLQSVYPVAAQHGGPGRFGFAPEMHLTERSPLISDANRQELLASWSHYWDRKRPVLIEKSPPNMLKTRFLQAMFPDARFILVLRHPIATALATQRMAHNTRIGTLMHHWLVSNELMLSDIPHLRHVTLLRYEDLIAEGDSELMRLHKFIGLHRTPYGLEPKRDLNDKYFSRWDSLRRSARGSLYCRLIVRRFETRVNRFGYSLHHPQFLAPREDTLKRLVPTP